MATDYFLIPQNRKFDQKDIFESTLKLLCMTQGVSYEKIGDDAYDIVSKTEDVGFAIDWVEESPYYWQNDFDPETEKTSGPEFVVSTHSSSIPFTLDFLKLLSMELDKKDLHFRVFDPQESKFIIE